MPNRCHLVLAALLALAVPALAQDSFTYSYDGYTAELPRDPQRVFVMDSRTGLDFAVSAGFPIVATDWDADEEMHFDALLGADVERLEFRGEPNAELVLTYDPDLLVVGEGWWNYWKDNNSFNASGLPVLVVKDGSGAEWKDEMVGQLTAYGRADQAARLLAQYDAAIAAARPRIAQVLNGRTVAITDIWGDQFALQTGTFSAAVARDLGIALASGSAPAEDGYQVYSAENLEAYQDAALIMSLWSADVADNPMWQRLPAIAGGAQFEMDTVNSWGFALTAIDFVDDVLEAMDVLEAADARAAAATAASACAPGTTLFAHDLLVEPVCVPEAPQRVAFIDDNVMTALELGIASVTRSYYSDVIVADFPGAAARLDPATTTHIGNTWEMHGEVLLTAQPDLVITGKYWEDAIPYAQDLAPTLIIDDERATTWRDTPRMLAALFGKAAEQAALEAGLDARVAAFTAALDGAGTAGHSFSFTQIESDTSFWTFTTEAFGPQFAVAAGMQLGPNIPTPEQAAQLPGGSTMAIPVSQENLDFIDADHIFFYANLGSDPEKLVEGNDVFQRFAAARPGRIHFIKGEYWFRAGIMSAHRIIDDLYRAVLGVDAAEASPNPLAWAYAPAS